MTDTRSLASALVIGAVATDARRRPTPLTSPPGSNAARPGNFVTASLHRQREPDGGTNGGLATRAARPCVTRRAASHMPTAPDPNHQRSAP